MGSGDTLLTRLGRRVAGEEAALLRRQPADRDRFVAAALAELQARRRRRALARGAALLAAMAAMVVLAFFLGRYRSGADTGPVEVRPDEARLAPLPVPAVPASPLVIDGGTPAATSPAPSAMPGPAPRPPTLPPAPPRPSWRDLSAAGRFKEALEAVDREGFTRLCAEGSAADLRDLGDAARLSGDFGRARTALGALRRRFPGDDQAAEAAFLLGVIAFGDAGAHEEQARWFTTYLTERPQGRLAREAAGRLLEVHVRSGDHAAAQKAARSYLAAFPGGPHAEMARAVIGE